MAQHTTDLCPQCGVALANHVCPQRVGTVPGVVTTFVHNGATVSKVVRAVSKNGACGRCGLVHHNERGTKLVCTAQAAANWANVKLDPMSPVFMQTVADFLLSEQVNGTVTVAAAAPVAAAPVAAAPVAAAPVAAPVAAPASSEAKPLTKKEKKAIMDGAR
jgi:ribosomal protein S27AE